jgi:hypothetical protein
MGMDNNNNKNVKLYIDKKEPHQDLYDQTGLDINQLSQNEREKFISILKKEFF